MKLQQRAGWQLGSSDEDSRRYLQERLNVLSKLMFWAFIALVVTMLALYRRYPDIRPQRQREIYIVSVAGLVLLVIIWRGLIVRTKLSLTQLYAVDAFYGASAGIVFASAAFLASELKMSATANILWSCLTVFMRTIVVPSTARRSAIISGLTMVPLVLTAVGLSYDGSDQEFEPPALIGSALLVAVVVVVLAYQGSELIFGLRQQVTEAKQLGVYHLDDKIGQGGNGAVYRASHTLLRRPTAIKVMRPERIDASTLDRFEREVMAMSQLSHPNTVSVFDYGRSPQGAFYYAMEYLDGPDLERLVTEHGPVPPDRAIAILVQVCGALQEAHARGLIHRDIKPPNIILCERGGLPDVAKVLDFGLVKEIEQDSADTKGVLGTPAYLAPETIESPDRVGPATDIYALGAVAYFLLAGRRVFDGKTAFDICVKHVTTPPTPLAEVAQQPISPELDALVLRCLAKNPADRPASADELGRLLRDLPRDGSWDEATARQWWADFRTQPRTPRHSGTMAITVDIAHRES
jgi:serine/threonine-protein kinase